MERVRNTPTNLEFRQVETIEYLPEKRGLLVVYPASPAGAFEVSGKLESSYGAFRGVTC